MVYGQNVAVSPSITPDFFTPDEEITITYDVTGTSLAGLSEAWLWLWLPDLDDVDVPSNVNPASSDPDATNVAKFTKSTSAGKTLFTISLVLTEFTNKTADEIERVGVLIKGNDWADGQSSDYVFDIADGFTLRVTSPEKPFAFYTAGEEIHIEAVTSQPATISLLVDGSEAVSNTAVDEFSYDHMVIADGNVHTLEVVASITGEEDRFVHSYTITPQTVEEALPAGMADGANYHGDATRATLVLTAPDKDNVFVLGDFNDWTLDQEYLMKRDGAQFWLELTGLDPGQEYIYQYLINGELVVADPYTEKISSAFDDGEIISDDRYPGLKPYPSGKAVQEAAYLQTARPEYDWQVTDFQKPAKEDLVVYELLIRDFTEARTYQAVTAKLDYLDSLGINAIELMPVMEFEGNLSWGYNPSFMMAPDKYYGTENDLKELIDEAHERGIAVILDIALNHQFGRSSLVRMYASGDFGPPTSNNVWFNTTPKHDFNVGYDFNHESQYTKDYVDRVVTYWVDEYKIDGYRFDLSKGFTQKNTLGNVGAWGNYDAPRIALLKRMADVIWAQDPSTYIILEHFADNSEEVVLSNYGMMLWGNMNGTFRNTAKGSPSDLAWLYHGARGWSDPHVVGYMESHDEERVMWDVSQNPGKSLEARLNRLKLNATFFFMVPGPKMIWQFGELGYDEELNDDRLGIKPTRWEYLDDPERVRLFSTYQSLINLKTQTEYLNDEAFTWQPAGSVKWINYDHEEVKISVFGNFSTSTQTADPHFVSAGEWYNYFTGEMITVEDPNADVELKAGEFYIYTSEPIENYIHTNPVDFITSSGWMEPEIQVFPNPTAKGVSISASGVKELRILDLSGKVLQVVRPSEAQEYLDLSGLKAGLYLFEFLTSEGRTTKRIIKY